MLRRLINTHAHHHHNGESLDDRVKGWRRDGVRKTLILCLNEWGSDYFGNEDLVPFLRKYPDDIVGMAYVNTDASLGPIDGKVIPRLREDGFQGLKIICPSAPYDHEQYFPIYEEAQRLRMPTLFHTGWCSIGQDWNRRNTNNEFMRPYYLDRIARLFPELPIIGAHLGNGFEEEAIKVLQGNTNVVFELSGAGGSRTRVSRYKKHLGSFDGANMDDPNENPSLGWFSQIVFGTDNAPVQVWYDNYMELMDYLHIPEETREKVFYGTAAQVLGLKD